MVRKWEKTLPRDNTRDYIYLVKLLVPGGFNNNNKKKKNNNNNNNNINSNNNNRNK
jgi:hypothetical protein